jgi:transketolase
MKDLEIDKIKISAKNMRRHILEMAYAAGSSSSHFGGALSVVEIISALFFSEMKIDVKDPNWDERDRFILSKGHACLAYYAALAEVGYLPISELKTFEKDGSNLLGHPIINKKIGIEFSTGSLGMGLSIGMGLAFSSIKKEKKFNVYVVLGDGECNEGSVWEAAMAAPNHKLNNLNVIIDHNKFQQTGSNKEIMSVSNLKEKWQSFGWSCIEINGHDIGEILNAFGEKASTDKPKAIIANTIKGKGFSFSENNNDWHHSVLSKSFYEQALKEI